MDKKDKPNEKAKWLGIVAIVIAALALLTSWMPFINNGSFVIAIISLILGVIALLINLKNKKLLALIGTGLSIVSMVIVLATQGMYSKAIDDATNTNSVTSSKSSSDKSNKSSDKEKKVTKILNQKISVDNGKAEITVTSWKMIPAGQPGNEYGDKPIIAFWYTVKNIKDTSDSFSPMNAWIINGNFKAVQDNNSDQVNTLNIGTLPDDKFMDTQSQGIKQGGTAENAVSYELTDETTPVVLSAYSSAFDTDKDHLIAQETFELK